MFSTNKFSIFAWYWSCVSEPNDEQDTLKASWFFFLQSTFIYILGEKNLLVDVEWVSSAQYILLRSMNDVLFLLSYGF